PAFIAASPHPTPADDDDPETALQRLIVRYMEGFGPVSVADVAQFTSIPRGRIKAALRALAGELERLEGPSGEELFDIPNAPRPDAATPAPPRLMAMWDSVLLAYADRSRIIPPERRPYVIRTNGDVLPTLLIDGYVAGVWRPVAGGIETTVFHSLPDDVWAALAGEARALANFLASREPEVYRRYGHWWGKLPDGEVRLLPME
ncbi:MAG: AlkZ family DNA glycosylase, partial [Thermomicrobiales bacterium]|nr:AlkZ family DNA glycosylase [Thermomicrobiales bacterium]